MSEKPIAADLKRARKLIEYYRKGTANEKGGKVKGGATWGVAENFRFLEPYVEARREIEKLGKIYGFGVLSLNYVAGGKYYGMLSFHISISISCVVEVRIKEESANKTNRD